MEKSVFCFFLCLELYQRQKHLVKVLPSKATKPKFISEGLLGLFIRDNETSLKPSSTDLRGIYFSTLKLLRRP